MKTSKFFISTLKEVPAEAEIVSHRLMLRAGMIRRLAAGIYTWLPLGLRVVRKVEAIVREEMNRAGALELADAGGAAGGAVAGIGPLAGVRARSCCASRTGTSATSCIQPTSEEVITDIARSELKSYRQLPVNFYQIQTKFRDERRPRFGVMRGREFIMKDAYSFHADYADLRARVPQHVRHLHAHLHAPRPEVPRGGGRHRRDRRHRLARVPGARRLRRGRDRVLARSRTTPPTSSWPKRSRPAHARRAEAKRCRRSPTPGKTTCEDVAALLKHAACSRRSSAVAVMHERAQFHLLLRARRPRR